MCFCAMENFTRPLVARIPALELPPQLQQKCDENLKHFDVIVAANPREIAKELADKIQGLVCYSSKHREIDADFMDLFPNLKVISNFGVGINHIDLSAASERRIAVGNTPGILSDATADMTFALLLASARNVVEGDRIARCPETKEVNLSCCLKTLVKNEFVCSKVA